MPGLSPKPLEIIHAYRAIMRGSLRAVQYSYPARTVLRDRIRSAFETNPASCYDAARIATTVEFLAGAARERGIEHRIVKNVCRVWWGMPMEQRGKGATTNRLKSELDRHIYRSSYGHFERTVTMLNESVGLCIPV